MCCVIFYFVLLFRQGIELRNEVSFVGLWNDHPCNNTGKGALCKRNCSFSTLVEEDTVVKLNLEALVGILSGLVVTLTFCILIIVLTSKERKKLAKLKNKYETEEYLSDSKSI